MLLPTETFLFLKPELKFKLVALTQLMLRLQPDFG